MTQNFSCYHLEYFRSISINFLMFLHNHCCTLWGYLMASQHLNIDTIIECYAIFGYYLFVSFVYSLCCGISSLSINCYWFPSQVCRHYYSQKNLTLTSWNWIWFDYLCCMFHDHHHHHHYFWWLIICVVQQI